MSLFLIVDDLQHYPPCLYAAQETPQCGITTNPFISFRTAMITIPIQREDIVLFLQNYLRRNFRSSVFPTPGKPLRDCSVSVRHAETDTFLLYFIPERALLLFQNANFREFLPAFFIRKNYHFLAVRPSRGCSGAAFALQR